MAGDSQAWNVHEYEYDLVESVLLIILVVFALAFEIFWHHVVHEVSHSYHYGVEYDNFIYGPEELRSGHHQKDSHGNLIHPRLVKQLVTRMSGEFMTLGFLALMIFILNQAEFFNFLANHIYMGVCEDINENRRLGEDSSDCWHVPRTGNDWLHMAEVVHVKLFLSMIFYFCIISRVVAKTNKSIQHWEKLRLRRLMEGEWPALTGLSHRSLDLDLQAFKELREYLIQNVLLVNGGRTKLFNELVSKLDVDLQMLTKKQKIQRIREEIDDRLSLSSYLAFNVETGLTDSIEVHVTTWIGIMGMFGTFALFNRIAKVEMAHIFPVFVVIGILFFFFMNHINKIQMMRIHKFVTTLREDELGGEDVDDMLTEDKSPVDAIVKDNRTLFERSVKERHVMRGLQAVMFIMTYALAETLADKHKWLAVPVQTLVLSLVYLVLFLVMLLVIPARIPTFLQSTALPPFVNRTNAEILLYVVLDDHSLRGKQDQLRKKIHGPRRSGSSTSSRDHDGYRPALALADIIAQCKDLQALAHVKETLLQRVQADCSGLTCDIHGDQSFGTSTVSTPSTKTPPPELAADDVRDADALESILEAVEV